MIKYNEIVKTLNNKKGAIKQLFEMFPNSTIEQQTSSYNARDFSSFYVNCKFEEFVKVCNEFYINSDSLFNYGTPKIIGKKTWVYNSSFVTIRLSLCIPYKYRDKDSEENINVSWRDCQGKKIGLKDWKKEYKNIVKFMDENEKIASKYRKKIVDINDNYIKWKEAIKNIACVD